MPTIFDSKKIKKLFNAESCLETNISELFLSPKYVYKIKKPVNLGFVNLINEKERFLLTKAEYAINKKISPNIYIGLIPIRKYGNELTLGKKGKILEYAIKMKRLPEKGLLVLLLKNKKISEKLIAKIVDLVAKMHLKLLSRDKKISKYGDPKTIRKNWENIIFLLKNDALGVSLKKPEFDKIKRILNLYLKKLAPVFKRRIKEGKIQRIHGDLHGENIFIDNNIPYITDAILPIKDWEFGDVAVDLATITMDFDAYDQEKLSDVLLNYYIKKTKDRSLGKVINFYKLYWAAIRLWVNSAAIGQNKKGAKRKAEIYKKLLFNYLVKI